MTYNLSKLPFFKTCWKVLTKCCAFLLAPTSWKLVHTGGFGGGGWGGVLTGCDNRPKIFFSVKLFKKVPKNANFVGCQHVRKLGQNRVFLLVWESSKKNNLVDLKIKVDKIFDFFLKICPPLENPRSAPEYWRFALNKCRIVGLANQNCQKK